ncbi:MAG TPA: tyrosine-type recombinase/integrase [Streptosporangiaceae bacterium]|nr:tyrosine-type recombinase/integrase [Streptosporangiaceae bacterium]
MACGLGGVRIHDLRHAHASWLLAGGADLQVVKERLGHSSIATTAKSLHPANRRRDGAGCSQPYPQPCGEDRVNPAPGRRPCIRWPGAWCGASRLGWSLRIQWFTRPRRPTGPEPVPLSRSAVRPALPHGWRHGRPQGRSG